MKTLEGVQALRTRRFKKKWEEYKEMLRLRKYKPNDVDQERFQDYPLSSDNYEPSIDSTERNINNAQNMIDQIMNQAKAAKEKKRHQKKAENMLGDAMLRNLTGTS